MQEDNYSSVEPRSMFSRWGPRVLAPLFLVGCAIAVLSVVNANDEPADQAGGARQASERQGGQGGGGGGGDEQDGGGENEQPETYVVEAGDNISTIAEEQGIPVERLERLNPDVDATALQPGQELTLR